MVPPKIFGNSRVKIYDGFLFEDTCKPYESFQEDVKSSCSAENLLATASSKRTTQQTLSHEFTKVFKLHKAEAFRPA